MLGTVAAQRLGVQPADGRTAAPFRSTSAAPGSPSPAIVGPLPLAPEIERAALIGYPIAHSLFGTTRHASTLYVRADPERVREADSLLGATADPAEPRTDPGQPPLDALQARADAQSTLTAVFLGLGAVALLVGGVGIANVMVLFPRRTSGRTGNVSSDHSAGWRRSLQSDYTTLAEDLASHGYIVVSFDAPYRTVITAFPDGRVATRAAGGDFDRCPPFTTTQHLATQLMSVWIADLKFALDQLHELNANDPTGRFKGKFDLQKLGIAGHSLGGATAAQFCHDDPRCAAGIDIDGMPFGSVIQDGLHQPFLFLMSDHSEESGSEPQTVEKNIESIYDHVPQGKR